MKAAKYPDKKKVPERGEDALHREPEPAEAQSFDAMANHKYEDSVCRHRKWQDSLDPEEFIGRIMAAHKKSR